jgi:NAD(P)-dependent dehydrogenase (short-subunit alcohol dehydrogenase family)
MCRVYGTILKNTLRRSDMTQSTDSKFRLDEKVAIVTGSGGGVGKGIALSLANMGAHVVVAEINPKIGEATAKEIRDLGRRGVMIAVDVTKSDQVSRLVELTMKEFGHIDILVNNAGGANVAIPIVHLTEEEWDFRIQLNLKSVFLCCRAIGRVMIDQNKGNIINIASAAGTRAMPGMAAYGTAKAGIINFTSTLAAELARYHIRVNCILPGPMDTEASAARRGPGPERAAKAGIPLGRIGKPEDIGLAAVYLASDASDFVSGSTIEVKGGPFMRKDDMDRFVANFPKL